jgi:N-acetylmuramoyl-L-alanine amidase
MTAKVLLPPLPWKDSPNQSLRVLPAGQKPHLIVAHRPVGSFASASATFMDPGSQVSAHALIGGPGLAAQFVAWDRKAWACVSFNSVSYNVEVADAAWLGHDPATLEVAARVFAFLCTRTGIPDTWTRDPLNTPGICRHYDLGAAGGGHTDPTTSTGVWEHFIGLVQVQFKAGGFRPRWGVGELPGYST